MPWVDEPVTGWVAGSVIGSDGKGIDGATVQMRHSGWSLFRSATRTVTDGAGWFGFAGVAPGSYEIRSGNDAKAWVDVGAGKVGRAELRSPN